MSQLPYYPFFIIFAPICREMFTLSFEIMVILDWTSPLRISFGGGCAPITSTTTLCQKERV